MFDTLDGVFGEWMGFFVCVFVFAASALLMWRGFSFRRPRFYMSRNQQFQTIAFVLARDWEHARRSYWWAARQHAVLRPSVALPVYPDISIPRDKVIVVSIGKSHRIALLDKLLLHAVMPEQRPFLVPPLPDNSLARVNEWVHLHKTLFGFSVCSPPVGMNDGAVALLGEMDAAAAD